MAFLLTGLANDAPLLTEIINRQNSVFLEFVDSCLRGSSQVVFTNNPICGLLIIIALFIQSVIVGFGSIVGLVSSTFFALIFERDKKSVRSGLYGFNGMLVGAALSTFCPNIIIYIPVVVFSFVSFLLQVAMGNVVGSFHLPVLTMPFNISALIFLFGTIIHHTSNNIDFFLWEIFLAIPRGIGQIYLCNSWISGTLIWFSILIGSRIAAAFAFIGSIVGIAMAYMLGADYQEIIQGLWGYNPALGAMAIGGFFFYLNWQTAIMAVLCASTTCLVFGMMKAIFSVWGVPSCTLGFCLGTFIFLLQRSSFRFFKPIPLELITTPEMNLNLIGTLLPNSEIELREVSVQQNIEIESIKSSFLSLAQKNDALKQELEQLQKAITSSSQGQ